MAEKAANSIYGHGTLAQHLRAMDWSASPLGAIASWSAELVSAVNMVLNAPLPMQLLWGPDLICIYNEALQPALSDKHPASFGRPAREVWAEAWHVIGPQLEAVRAEGKAFRFDDVFLPLLMNGKMEDQYWTYSYSPMFSADGAVAGIIDIAQDTTKAVLVRKELARAHEVMRRSEDRFRVMTERATVGINIGDASGSLSYMNQKLLDLLGYTADDVAQGKLRWNELTPERYAAADQRALEELKQTGYATPYEKSYRAKDGHLVPVQLGATMIPALRPDAEEDDIAVFFTDLSSQKRAEAALVQAEKLGAVGKLASAVSHEINNPLESITNVLYIVRHMDGIPQAARDYMDVMDRELARVGQVASQTLRFHRLSTSGLKVAPDDLVQEVLQLYSARLTNYHIEVKRDYAAGVSFTCFEGDVRQVLNNLVGNAVDMLRNGGVLTVRTREATRWSTGQKGVRITIADSGTGITPEARKKLFDAFYTTKGIHGTGLGLWISCRIVHKHRGYIRAFNAFGKSTGAIFQVWLPLDLASSAGEPWHDLSVEPGLHTSDAAQRDFDA